MVRFEEPDEYQRLDALVREVVARLDLHVESTGWTRKMYDIYTQVERLQQRDLIARVESFATTSGEIRIFDDRAIEFARKLGEQIEASFKVKEAVILREPRPV